MAMPEAHSGEGKEATLFMTATPTALTNGGKARAVPLYTAAERARRDATVWTRVQAVLAPLQFFVFLVSVALMIRYAVNGTGLLAVHVSILAKTALLYTIMITGSIWEKVVFGRYLFAPSFFWEDAVSMVVIALHTVYLVCFFGGYLSDPALLALTALAYAIYAVNALQFLLKLRAARLQGPCEPPRASAAAGGVS